MTDELRAKFEAWATTDGAAYYGDCSFDLDQDGEYAQDVYPAIWDAMLAAAPEVTE